MNKTDDIALLLLVSVLPIFAVGLVAALIISALGGC